MNYLFQLSQEGGSLAKAGDAESDLVSGTLRHALQLELLLGERQHFFVCEQREQVSIFVQPQALQPRRYVCNVMHGNIGRGGGGGGDGEGRGGGGERVKANRVLVNRTFSFSL